jgi:transcriptional regulator with XRE-family HTH domain
LDVDPTYISHLEKDRRDPSVKLLRRIAAVSQVPTMMLIALALWSELPEEERNAFRPLLASLTRLSGVAQNRAEG